MNHGMSIGTSIAVVAALLVIGGALYYNMRPEAEIMMGKGADMMEKGEKMMNDGGAMVDEGEHMMKEGEAMMEGDGVMHEGYEGAVLASSDDGALLLDFHQADYEKALAEGKFVVLFFYANWCPLCKEEFPKMEEAFKGLGSGVIGFRVNYNDSQTDSDEKALARTFGISYQHTKVFVKNGERVLKSPETWDTERYTTEINAALNQ